MMRTKTGLTLLAFLLLLPALGCGEPEATLPGAPATVTSTTPARDATGVAINASLRATFSGPMDTSTVTASTFLLNQGSTAVPGSVTCDGTTARFVPTTQLAATTKYTATLTTGIKDAAGNALESALVWEFTTAATADTTAPFVAKVTGNDSITATFSEPVSPSTVSASTFTVTAPGEATVAGTVTYEGLVATFLPTVALSEGTRFTAKLQGGANGVTDLTGNPMAQDFAWSFTKGPQAGLAPVLLGGAGEFVILAQSAVSTVPTSAVTGDIALSPAAASYITGFALVEATGYATSSQVVGKVYAADYSAPTSTTLTTAVSDMGTAYTDAAGRPTPDFLELGTGAIGGLVLAPGLYKWTGSVTIASDVVLEGAATDVWILQIAGDLSQSAGKKVILRGGAKASNIFWQVAGAVDLGTTAHFEGILLCKTAIAMMTGSSLNGRALAQTAVTLDASTVTQPAP